MERVLIIEDDELIAELERDYLEANGILPLTASPERKRRKQKNMTRFCWM